MKKTTTIKTVLPPILPQINVELADRLLRQAEEKKAKAQQEAETKTVKAVIEVPESKTVPVSVQTASVPAKTVSVTVSSSISVRVKLLVGTVNDPLRTNCVWGWVQFKDDDYLHVGATLNTAFEPVRRAIAEKDCAMLRWLTLVAIAERALNLDRYESYGKALRRYLWDLAGIRLDRHWDGLGVAFRLAQHEMTAAIADLNWAQQTLYSQKFAEFSVTIPGTSGERNRTVREGG
jgi:hypothetical protein